MQDIAINKMLEENDNLFAAAYVKGFEEKDEEKW